MGTLPAAPGRAALTTIAAWAAVASAVSAACVAGVAADPAPSADGQTAAELVYVTNQDDATVSVIDAERFEVVTTLDLREFGFSENARPHHVVVEPDGSHWYLSLIGENRVLKLDRDNRVVGEAAFEVPGLLALHPDGERLYVGRSMSAVNPPARIGVIQRSDMAIDEIEVFLPRPHALVVHHDGSAVYTASLAENRVGVVDADDWQVELTTVEGPVHSLMQMALSPDGRTLAASGELSGELLFFDLSDPVHPQLAGTVAVGRQPFDPVFARDGRRVYLGNKAANTLSVIDVAEGAVVRTIEGEGIFKPHGAVVSPDGRHLFVSNNGPGAAAAMAMPADHDHDDVSDHVAAYDTGTVVVVDTATLEVVAVIPVGRNATGIGLAGGP